MSNTQNRIRVDGRVKEAAAILAEVQGLRSNFEDEGLDPGEEKARIDLKVQEFEEAVDEVRRVRRKVDGKIGALRRSRDKAMKFNYNYDLQALQREADKLGQEAMEILLPIIVQGKFGGSLDHLRGMSPGFGQVLKTIEKDNLLSRFEEEKKKREAEFTAEMQNRKASFEDEKRKWMDRSLAEKEDWDAGFAAEKGRWEFRVAAQKQQREADFAAEKQSWKTSFGDEKRKWEDKYTSEKKQLEALLTAEKRQQKAELSDQKGKLEAGFAAEKHIWQAKHDAEKKKWETEQDARETDADRAYGTILESYDAAQTSRNELTEKCSGLVSEKDALEHDNEKLVAYLASLRRELQEAQDSALSFGMGQEAVQNKYEALKARYNNRADKCSDLLEASRIDAALYAVLDKKYQDLEAKQIATVSDRNAMQVSLGNVEEDLTYVRGQLKTAGLEAEKLRRELLELRQERIGRLEPLANEVPSLRDQIQLFRSQADMVPGLERVNKEKTAEIAKLGQEAARVPDLESQLRSALAEAGQKEAAEARVRGLGSDLSLAREEVARLQPIAAERGGLQEKIVSLEKDLSEQRGEVSQLAPVAAKVPGLELKIKKETEQHKKAADRLLQVDRVAKFFTWHHTGQVGKISLWVQLINQWAYPTPGLELGQDDEAPWTMMNWWPAEGGRSVAKLDRNSTRDLVITAYGWILAGTIDEQLCHVVCILTGHMENNEEASAGPVLELSRAYVDRLSNLDPSSSNRDMLRYLCLFGFWQLVEIVDRRWPDTPRLAETSLRIREALDDERSHQSVVIAARLLGDGGARLKTWIRANVVDGDEVEDEVMAELLPKANFMYVVERDFAFVVLPGSEGFVWVFDLESNSLRMVSMSRAQWPSTKIFRLGASDDDMDLEFIVTQPRFSWIYRNFV
ncbi:hypothetical protein AB5N19_12354 [Seiridium cardinale]|uniref:Uncharacterized protein n=1 Tax=Seiridium cardinale TaxID=138064 RepID=A0ABR2XTJ8_9PEZI